MDLLIIRHAPALEREEWTGDDMLRPLSADGHRAARAFFQKLREIVPAPDRILTSPATRAVETSCLLHHAFRGRKPTVAPELAPGCAPEVIVSAARKGSKERVLALVGHEPDLSLAVAVLIGCPRARIKLAKGACAWLRRVESGYELRMLVTPKQLG
jgi:phosphohistidine phosphatase SixA